MLGQLPDRLVPALCRRSIIGLLRGTPAERPSVGSGLLARAAQNQTVFQRSSERRCRRGSEPSQLAEHEQETRDLSSMLSK